MHKLTPSQRHPKVLEQLLFLLLCSPHHHDSHAVVDISKNVFVRHLAVFKHQLARVAATHSELVKLRMWRGGASVGEGRSVDGVWASAPDRMTKYYDFCAHEALRRVCALAWREARHGYPPPGFHMASAYLLSGAEALHALLDDERGDALVAEVGLRLGVHYQCACAALGGNASVGWLRAG
eukprot:355474-Chlamydomonas_euryale.AAC.4